MNFLSHYYFDRNISDSNMIVGMVLPDLVKNADKTWNLHPDKIRNKWSEDPVLSTIALGWARHLEVDCYFHSSEFFKLHTQNIRTLVAPVLTNSPVRPSFLAHISLELILDSLLIVEDVLLPDNFYKHLVNADRLKLEEFLRLNSIADTELFFNFFDEFIRSEYLYSYRESHNIMYALNRICMRLWSNPFNETQKMQLTALLLEYQKKLSTDFISIFNEIDVLLNQTPS